MATATHTADTEVKFEAEQISDMLDAAIDFPVTYEESDDPFDHKLDEIATGLWCALVKLVESGPENVYGGFTWAFVIESVDSVHNIADGTTCSNARNRELILMHLDIVLYVYQSIRFRRNAWQDLFSRFKPGDKKKRPQGYVYAIRNPNTGSIKFGYSANTGERLKNLSAAAGAELRLLGAVEATLTDEGNLLKILEKHKIISEWFLSNATTEAIADAIVRGDSIESVLDLARNLTA